jgi:hypothetical protein
MWYVSKADGWTLHFTVGVMTVTCFDNGLLFWQNALTVLVAVAFAFPCILSMENRLLAFMNICYHIVFLWVGWSSIYTHWCAALSTWVGLQLVLHHILIPYILIPYTLHPIPYTLNSTLLFTWCWKQKKITENNLAM